MQPLIILIIAAAVIVILALVTIAGAMLQRDKPFRDDHHTKEDHHWREDVKPEYPHITPSRHKEKDEGTQER